MSAGALDSPADALRGLVERGLISHDALEQAGQAAAQRGLFREQVLVQELGLPRQALLEVLAAHFGCPAVGFDERVPVSVELLTGLDRGQASRLGYCPLLTDGATTVVAAADPRDPSLLAFLDQRFGVGRYELWVALKQDIEWYLLDYAHARVGRLVGTERTGLAFWRNTMAQWRTRLACIRTDFAKLRTSLALARWGLGLIALADALARSGRDGPFHLPWFLVAAGLVMVAAALPSYWSHRRAFRGPGHHGLVEVTAATLHFTGSYSPKDLDDAAPPLPRLTMLARQAQALKELRTTLDPPPVQKERTPLARERTVLAGERTVVACTRTIYARARTGLAFIRTGVSFVGLGLGLTGYFGYGVLSIVDGFLVVAGLFLVVDGVLWYLPVRKEEAELPHGLA